MKHAFPGIRQWTLATLICVLAVGCGSPRQTVRVGFISGLSGGNADTGEAGRNGAMIAVEEFNEHNTVKAQLIIRDDGNDVEQTRQAAEDLTARKVDVIIGAFTTTTTEAIVSVAGPKKVLVLTPSASAFHLFGKDDELILLNSSTKDNAGDYAMYMHKRAGLTRVSIARDTQNDAFSRSWLTFFEQRLSEEGGIITAIAEFDSRELTDYRHLVKTLLHDSPDTVLFIANSVDTARIAQQLRKADQHIPLFAAEWAGTEQLIELGGASVEGMRLLQNVNLFDEGPDFVRFRGEYYNRFGRNPSYSSVMAYEAVNVVLTAYLKKTPRQSMKNAALHNGPYKGLTQMISFNKWGDMKRESHFVMIRNKTFLPAQD
ncbi:MAG: ABC transporter substrate-binding protein [Spirochaetales bacterium]|nr:ABC transporter substrate-binding protein [Spirochaetales bacterium]